MKFRALGLNFFLSILTLFLCVAAAEGALRLIYPKPSGDRVASFEYHHRWVFNSDGFRDEEFSEKLKKNKSNQIFLGDSFTVGLGSEREESFASLLSAKEADRYETFNLGKCATGTFNQLTILKLWIDRIHPQRVVLFFFWNDVADNFIMPVDASHGSLQTRELSKEKPFFAFLKPLKPAMRKIILYEFLSQRYRILMTRLGISKLDYGMEFDLFEKEVSSIAVKFAWENTEKSLRELKNYAMKNPVSC